MKVKFRTWDWKNNVMIYAIDWTIVGIDKVWLADPEGVLNGAVNGKKVFTQFTGLIDVNGKEIYEGDILAYPNGIWDRGQDDWDDRMEVYYDEKYARFGLLFRSKWGGEGYTGKDQDISDYLLKAEIIGNIFQHPNL